MTWDKLSQDEYHLWKYLVLTVAGGRVNRTESIDSTYAHSSRTRSCWNSVFCSPLYSFALSPGYLRQRRLPQAKVLPQRMWLCGPALPCSGPGVFWWVHATCHGKVCCHQVVKLWWKTGSLISPSTEGKILETSLLRTEREMLLSLITLVSLLKLPRFLFLECVCPSQFPQRSCLLDTTDLLVLRIPRQLWLPEQCLQKVKPAEHYWQT